jgi:toxin ParE1/3/4
MKVFKSHQAQEDLIDIWLGIYPESEAAANRLLDQIEAKLSLLPEFPEMGAARDDIRPGLRMLISGEYLVLYRILGREIEIVRVVHGRRDLEAL